MLLFSRDWFVSQDMEEAGAELQEIDVAGDRVVPEGAGELILLSEPQNVSLDNNVY